MSVDWLNPTPYILANYIEGYGPPKPYIDPNEGRVFVGLSGKCYHRGLCLSGTVKESSGAWMSPEGAMALGRLPCSTCLPHKRWMD